MNVIFYSQFLKKRNSTERPTTGTTISVKLKDGCSVQNPTLILQWDSSQDSPVKYNYCHISAFANRYYYIDNWTYNDRQWIASCSVDVLATYKNRIGLATKYILRAASDYDPNVPDNKYIPIMPAYQMATQFTADNPSDLVWVPDLDRGWFVIAVTGANNAFNAAGTGYYVVGGNKIQQILDACFTNTKNVWSSQQSLGNNVGEALAQFGENYQKSVFNPQQFISSITWFPFPPPTSGSGRIYLGEIDTGVDGAKLSAGYKSIHCRAQILPDVSRPDAWMYTAPFASYRVHFPPFADIELPSDIVAAYFVSYGQNPLNIDIYMDIDILSGDAILNVLVAGDPVGSSTTRLGVPMQLAGAMVNTAGQVQSAMSSVGSLAGGLLSGNILGGITGTVSGIQGFVEAGAPKATSGGSGGGLGAIASHMRLNESGVLIAKYFTVPDMDIADFGRPLMQNKQISTLSGFIQCAEGHIELQGSPAEAMAVENFLTGGFFYE